MGEPVRVGVVGAGVISGQYLATLAGLAAVEVIGVADRDRARADATAARHGIRSLSVGELLDRPEIELVLNLTVPAAHAEIAWRAVTAGKHVYGEKPLTASRASALELLAEADTAGVRVGCAPDTVLGTGIQTARNAIDSGAIGLPISATATMMVPGHELWHPNPDFYYQPGGGPLLDMGPYYISALVTLLGPVVSVIGSASGLRSQRTIASGPRAGERVPVATPSHVTGVLRHASGALSTLVMSFDAVATRASSIEVHGEEASMVVPDPNVFDGDVLVRGIGEDSWQMLPISAGYRNAGRGFGVADLAIAPEGVEHRANGRLAMHVLDVMLSLLDAAACGSSVEVVNGCRRPAAVPLGDAPGGIR